MEVDTDRDVYDRLVVKDARGIWRAKVFLMPAVTPGSIIEYRYRQTYPPGFRYFALDLQSDLFIKTLLYRIQPQAASPLDVRWVAFNAPNPSRFDPVWDGAYNIKAENIPPFRREVLMPPEQTVKMWGWLYYSNETEKNPDKYWKNYARLMSLRVGDETKVTRAVRRVAETVTLASDSFDRKAERIYSYLRTDIKNTGVEPREGRSEDDVRPNASADATLKRRRGTPREIARLFVALARAVGVDARIAALTTRDENFFNRNFLDSFQLNGEVVAVVAPNGSVKFYDPGTPNCPLGMLPWEKEAVPALVYGKNDSRFVETPLRSAAENMERRRLVVTPQSNGRIRVEFEASLYGQRALQLRSDLANLEADQQRKHVIKQLNAIHETVTVDESSIKILNDNKPAQPLLVKGDILAPGLARLTETRLILSPASLSRPDQNLLTSPARVNKVYFQFPWSEADDISITIPEGYSVEQMPDPFELDIEAARYHRSFRREANRVIYERRLAVNAIVIEVDEYPTLKRFFDSVQQADQAVVSFKR
jgi:transglutaminase-like putative cysteine protease